MAHRKHFLALVLATACLCPLGVQAQGEPDDAQTDTFSGPAMMSDEQIMAMDTGERVGRVTAAIGNMEAVLDRAMQLLEAARSEERDVLKLNCINEKISAIKGFLKVAEQARYELDGAITANDDKEQVHQTRLVMLSETRVQALGEETESCAGEIVHFSGDFNIEVEVDENVRTDNPATVDTSDVPLDPVPKVSPYQ